MKHSPSDNGQLSRAASAALAATALLAPAVAAVNNSPNPRNPQIDHWYGLLRKPRFNPPKAVFPLAWTAIESALAVGAYRLARRPASSQRNLALGLWIGNVAMIAGWSRLFFGRRQLAASSAASGAMVAAAGAYVAAARPVDRLAAHSGLPLAAWLTFAAVLSTTIWRMNRDRDPR